MKALSVRAPWWWAILYACKDIENRGWSTPFRGRVLLHASSWYKKDEVDDDWNDVLYMAADRCPADMTVNMPPLRDAGGHLVGTVDVVGCVDRSDSPWFVGPYGFMLANPKPLAKPIPFRGQLGFFDVPNEILPPEVLA